jgi:alpha,alpha-trehalase
MIKNIPIIRFLCLAMCFLNVLCGDYRPEIDLYPLFQDVQTSSVYHDSKTFVDLDIKEAPWEVVESYKKELPFTSKEKLIFFINKYFQEINNEKPFPSSKLAFDNYLVSTWNSLLRNQDNISDWSRSTLIYVPNAYTVAGQRFKEMYYWDSFFSMLGLRLSNKTDILEGMVENFSYLIKRFGFIPNGNRTYFLSRSQPPFFSLMIKLTNNPEQYYEDLQKEYGYWQCVKKIPSHSLSRYLDVSSQPRPEGFKEDLEHVEKLSLFQKNSAFQELRTVAESGWDFSSRWYGQNKEVVISQLAPVDLNCLLYHMEMTLGDLAKSKKNHQKASEFYEAAKQRKKAVNTYCWDSKKEFYFDYNFESKTRQPYYTLAAAFPLFFGVASKEQAKSVAQIIENQFLKDGGLVTTLYESKEQWDYPNGWAPLEWIAIGGLKNYGFDALAEKIAERWLNINESMYHKTGFMIEKYDVVHPENLSKGGEYKVDHGFGWSNGVAQDLLNQRTKKEDIYSLFFYP